MTPRIPSSSREVVLARYPRGMPQVGDFDLVERPLRAPRTGEILVRNTYMSLDPVVRVRLTEGGGGYPSPITPGSTLDGWAIGHVMESSAVGFAAGDVVLQRFGWRDFAVLDTTTTNWGDPVVVPIDDVRTESRYLGPLGPSGLTSWAGLLRVAALAPGDVVFVSGAAGAVGSLVVQLAVARGHQVIGSAGSAAKVAYLTERLGAAAAFDYHDGPVVERLRDSAPTGIDVYFDNVGGEHLEAALDVMNPGGRVALCGQISQYNAMDGSQRGPSNLFLATVKGLTLRGFLARMFASDLATFQDEVAAMMANGAVTSAETVRHGLDAAPQALVDLLGGGNVGKMLVCLD